ncbi:murein DD-endopeptidase MepM/ murein hydrolase activator NlpD [Paenibacillus sp. JGP012]|uniref:M23 family metallopeptidase n=1 Tax=Paenibacillus sp. JGP012 TaxID=2735914 RepID=UPI00161680D9|nr:M23 family metallopeptidase [Paenibacillus sp. JGP012]MBB6021381.1 murein DD-endopeptidase MepM/ murein hydrolase activator NlpD [Paenibacillus sp. JGP012]
MDQWIKQAVKRAGRKAGLALLKVLAPYVLPIVAFILVLMLGYFIIFEMPKQAIMETYEHAKDQVAGFFYGTKEEEDQQIFETYQRLAERWREGLTAEEEFQVEPYTFNWEWLAQVDRSLNDPSFLNTILDDYAKEVVLKPEETFEEVRPKFKWNDAEIVTVKEVCVQKEGKEGEVEYAKSTVTERQPVRLLQQARTIQNEYNYTYASETLTETVSSPCGTLTTKVTQDKLQQIKPMHKEDWEPLREILIAHGAKRLEDQDFLLEYWLSYLSDYDGEGGGLNEGWTPISGDLIWPTKGDRITSSFGYRIHPITGKKTLHAGVDVGVPIGTPVYAAKAGTVIFADYMGKAGNAIMIQHEDMETRYYHLNKIKVEAGQEVQAGEEIAESGNTGGSTGPHLHFEVRVNGNPVNPLLYFGYTVTADILTYRSLNISVMLEWLNKRNSMLATKEILTMIDDAAKAQGVDPYLLIAITGAEQGFVPKSNKYANQIVKNPWNVFGSWKEGKGSTLTTKEAAEIAAKTIVKLSKGKPATANSIAWLSDPMNPSGVYAEGGDWVGNVSNFYQMLSELRD